MIDRILIILIGLQLFIHASIVTDRWVPVFNLGGISIGTTDLMIIFSLMLIFMKHLSQFNEMKKRLSQTSLLMLCLIFIGILGLINGFFLKGAGLNMAVRDSRPFFLYLTYFSVLSLDASKKNITRIYNIILLIALLSSILSVLQVALGERLLFIAGKVQNLKTGGNEYTGVTRIAGASTPIITCAILFSLFRLFEQVNLKRLLILFIIGIGFLFLFARGVTVSIFLAMLSIIPFTDLYLKKRIMIGLTVTFILGALFFGAGASGLMGGKSKEYAEAAVDRFSTLSISRVTQDQSFMYRFDEAERVMEKIKKRPLIGHGFGATAQTVDWDEKRKQKTSFVHNGYINMMFRLGFIGLLTYLFMIISYCLKGLRRIRLIEDSELKFYHSAFITFTIAILPLCIVQPANMTKNWIIVSSVIMAMSHLCYLADKNG